MLQITLSDGKTYALSKKDNVQLKNEGTYGNGSIDWGARGLYLYEIAEQLGVQNVVAANVNGQLCTLDAFVTQDCEVTFVGLDSAEGYDILRRTGCFLLGYGAKQVLGEDMQRLEPLANMQGEVYIDFALSSGRTVTDVELGLIQQHLDTVLKSETYIQSRILPYYTTIRRLREIGEQYLIEQIERQDDGGPVSVDLLGDYFDLHRGLLLQNFRMIQHIKILGAEHVGTRCRIYADVRV